MAPSYCSVPGCSSNRKNMPYLSFHDFPADLELRTSWVRAMRRDEGPQFKILRGSTFICSLHFSEEDTYVSASGWKKLKKGAVPSRFAWNNWGKGGGSQAWEPPYQRARKRLAEMPVLESSENASSPDAVLDHDYTCHPSPDHRQRISNLDQEEPERPHIKEEEQELCIKQEETEIITVSGKSEGDEEKHHSPHSVITLTPDDQIKDEFPPEQQERISSVDQELLHIKVEEEELSIKEEETDVIAVIVKSEDMEETLGSSGLHQSNTEDNIEDGEGPEPPTNLGPDGHLSPCTEIEIEDSSETEDSGVDDEDDDWKETDEIESLNKKVSSDMGANTCDELSDSECGQRFENQELIQRHVNTHYRKIPFGCSECGKRFSTKWNLRSHEKTHKCEKPFSCSVCGKQFSTKWNLRSHERIHTGEKPFSCSECGKRFVQRTNLRKHEKTHRGEKRFSCSQCSKRFIHKSSLNKHEKFHTAEKPFSCPECGKIFTRKSSLKSHEKIHTGEKPFSCSQCGKKFVKRTNLRRHETIHSEEKPFCCSHCGKRYALESRLRTHQKLHRETI